MNLLQRAGKNIFWLFMSEVCARGFAFIAILYLARILGTSGFGLYSLGLAMGAILWGIADAGVTGYGLREVAKDRDRAGELLNSLNSMRIVIAILTFLFLSITLFSLNMPPEKKSVLLLGGLYILAYSISPDWVFQGLEQMQYLVVGKVANSLSFLVTIFLFVKAPSNVYIAILFFSVFHLIGGIILLSILYKRFKICFTPTFSITQWWNHFRESFFFFLGGSVTNLGNYIPIFLLSIFSSNAQLGIFSASHRLIMIVFAMGNIVTLGIYPMLSNLYSNDIKAFRSLHTTYQNLVIFVGLPLATVGMLAGNDIVSLLFGHSYERSGDIMMILVWLVPFSLLRLNYGRTLLSANFHRFNTIALGSGAFVTFVLCVFLIPRYEGMGAAWALIGGEVITLLLMKWMASLKLNTAKLINIYTVKILIASFIVGIVLLRLHFHVVINITLGIVFYGILTFILGIISREKIMKALRG